jgi:N-acetylglucosaminyl-diphospho-decaprenol L-rhamnosyltransferase
VTRLTDVAIVIVSFNARRDLERCLRSLHDAPPSVLHEIVVVDNASSDGSVELVRREWPDVRVIDMGRNAGFSAANNAGIRATESELVLLLNNDTVVPPGAIDALAGELRADPRVGVLAPRLVDASGRPELSFGPMIGPLAELRQKYLLRLYERGFGPAVAFVNWQLSAVRRVDWVSGACLLVRRDAAEQIGLLDERFLLYCEDVDFCAAIRGLGREVRYTPSVEIQHLRGRSLAKLPRLKNYVYRHSQLAFYAKHHPRWAPILWWYLKLKGALPDGSVEMTPTVPPHDEHEDHSHG